MRNRTYLLLVWLLTPITFPFIISQLSQPIYLTRGTIGASLAFYLIVAKGMDAINSKLLKLLVISLVIFMFSFNLQEYYVKVNNEQWREVASYVDMNAKPGDLILFNAGSTQTLVFDYYSKRNDLIKKPFTGKTRKITDENIKELGPTVEGHNRVWLILSHSHDFKGLIKKTLAESYNLPYHKKYRGIDLSLFEHQN